MRLFQYGITVAVASATLTLSACSSLSQVQGSLGDFDQGARAVNTAQMTYFNNVHDVECEQQFYRSAFAYSQNPNTPLDLRAKCQSSKLFLTSAQIQTRQHLLDAISLYAAQLNALGSSDLDSNLDDQLQTDAAQLNSLAATGELSRRDASITSNVEAAVIALANMVLDQTRAHDIRKAAAAHQADLNIVVKTLKDENVSIASGIDDYIREMRANLITSLAYARQTQGSAVFFETLRARQYLHALAPFSRSGDDDSTESKDPSGPNPHDPDLNAANAVTQLNEALESLLMANHAIATSGNGGIAAAVQDLVSRAQAAYTFQIALQQ